MAILKVTAGGKSFIIDCANKGTAKAWGASKLDVVVTDATGDDISAFMLEGGAIEKVAPAPKKEAAPAVAEAAAEATAE